MGPVNITLYEKKVFVDVIEPKILKQHYTKIFK